MYHSSWHFVFPHVFTPQESSHTETHFCPDPHLGSTRLLSRSYYGIETSSFVNRVVFKSFLKTLLLWTFVTSGLVETSVPLFLSPVRSFRVRFRTSSVTQGVQTLTPLYLVPFPPPFSCFFQSPCHCSSLRHFIQSKITFQKHKVSFPKSDRMSLLLRSLTELSTVNIFGYKDHIDHRLLYPTFSTLGPYPLLISVLYFCSCTYLKHQFV